MGKPTPAMLKHAKRVLAYLYYTRHLGLRYEVSDTKMMGMSDASFEVNKATSGFVFMYQKAAINWSSKQQKTVALSSCEAEVMAQSEAAKDAIFLRALLRELGEDPNGPTVLAGDNKAAQGGGLV